MQDPNTRSDPGFVPYSGSSGGESSTPPVAQVSPPPSGRRRGLVALLVLVGIVAVGGGFVAMIGGMMKSNDAYRNAMAQAEADCRVAEAIGTPLDAGMFVSGTVETSGPGGHAELSIPVDGSNGSGTNLTDISTVNCVGSISKGFRCRVPASGATGS